MIARAAPGAMLGLWLGLLVIDAQAGVITSMRQLPTFDQGFLDLALTSGDFATGFHTQTRSPVSLADALRFGMSAEAVVKLIGNEIRTQPTSGPAPILLPPPDPGPAPGVISGIPLLPPPVILTNDPLTDAPAAMPEPASLAMWAAAGLAMGTRRLLRRRAR